MLIPYTEPAKTRSRNSLKPTRYAADWEYARLTGVFVRGHGHGMVEDLLAADVVVDATGRWSQTPGWPMAVAVVNSIAPRPGLIRWSAVRKWLRAARREPLAGPDIEALAPETEYGRRLKHGDTTATGRSARARATRSRSAAPDGGGDQLGAGAASSAHTHSYACVRSAGGR